MTTAFLNLRPRLAHLFSIRIGLVMLSLIGASSNAQLPGILSPRRNSTVLQWQPVDFRVRATGVWNYHWLKDGVPLPYATGEVYRVPVALMNHAGSYTVIASNGAGTVTSSPPAVLQVVPSAPPPLVGWGINAAGESRMPAGPIHGIKAVAAGAEHNLVLTTNGEVIAWGANGTELGGGVGDGWRIFFSPAAEVPRDARTGVVAIAACEYLNAAVKEDGSVVVWGENIPEAFRHDFEPPASAQSNVAEIAVGRTAIAAIKTDGSLVVWGRLGLTNVPPQALTGVKDVTFGEQHALALKHDGSVVGWGGHDSAPEAAQSGVVAIAAGGKFPFSLALKQDGTVISWGGLVVPASLRTGIVSIAAADHDAILVRHDGLVVSISDWHTVTNFPPGSDIVSVACGRDHSIALKRDGSVVAWGENTSGQGSVPTGLKEPIAIACGRAFTAALQRDGAVKVWGDGYVHDVPLEAQSGVTAIAAGPREIFAVRTNGSVIGWSRQVFTLPHSNVAAVAVAETEALLFLKRDGSVSSSSSNVPPQAATNVVAIAAGEDFFVALNRSGAVHVWRARSESRTLLPVPTAALSGVKAIAAGRYHILALKQDGSVMGWTLESHHDQRPVAIPVQAQADVVAIAAGSSHSLALKRDGTVIGWGVPFGYHDYLQSQPLAPQGMHGVAAIAAGGFLSVALMKTTDTVPTLRPVAGDHNLIVSWPASSEPFTLQTATRLGPQPDWADVLEKPILMNGEYTFELPRPGGARFFRLRSP
jgi:alpha-tubulin suppressor-like RCC1 family protein